jgi:hypothetical protein
MGDGPLFAQESGEAKVEIGFIEKIKEIGSLTMKRERGSFIVARKVIWVLVIHSLDTGLVLRYEQ